MLIERCHLVQMVLPGAVLLCWCGLKRPLGGFPVDMVELICNLPRGEQIARIEHLKARVSDQPGKYCQRCVDNAYKILYGPISDPWGWATW